VRILIVKTSSMGDVVHALPLAADLASQQGVEIDWLVEESFAAIPAMSRHVRRVHRVALRRWRKALFQPGTWREIAAVKQSLRAQDFDWVLDVQGLLKSAWMARWTGACVAGPSSDSARERVASMLYTRRVAIPRELHAVERCRRLGAAVFGYAIDGPPRFDLTVVAEPVMALPGSYAVLLVNASRATKLWGAERWIALERSLAEAGMASVLFWGSPDEEQRVQSLVTSMMRGQAAPKSPIDKIASTLAGARVVIGLDTGLTHLAAALGRPTVGIYCDYDPALVGLVGDGPVRSLGGVGRPPSSEDVIAAVRDVMGRA
jgi:heptosyltransferase-1